MNFVIERLSMKTSRLILLLFVSGVQSHAVASTWINAQNDSTHTKSKTESEGYWGGISLSAASMAQFQGNLENYDASWGVRPDLGMVTDDALISWRMELNPFEYRQRILGEFVAFTTGLGFDWWHFGVDNEHILQLDESTEMVTALEVSGDSLNMQKNQLNAVYLRLPLLISLRTARSGSKGLHVEAGLVGGYLLGRSYEYEYKMNGSTSNFKEDNFPINPLQINGRIGIGFKNVSLLGEASLLPFFDEVQTDAPTMHSFSLGLQFAFND